MTPCSRVVRARAEVAVFVTRKGGAEVLILRRSAPQGGYWHVVTGGVEAGETATAAAERELRKEAGLVAPVGGGVEVVEYVDGLGQSREHDLGGTLRERLDKLVPGRPGERVRDCRCTHQHSKVLVTPVSS